MKDQTALQGIYAQQYRRLHRRLCRQVGVSEDRQQALDTLAAMLIQAQQQGLPPETVYGGNFEDFYEALLSQLPNRLTAKQQALGLLRRIVAVAVLAAVIFVLCIGLFWKQTGAMDIRQQGFQALSQLKTEENQLLTGSFFLVLDLERPEENLGQPLYQDESCSITVAGVYPQQDGNVWVTLRCRGKYNWKQGRLVSLSEFEQGEAQPSKATFQVKWGEQTFAGGYALPGAGLEKDGCQGALLLFPPNQMIEWQQSENQIVHIQLDGLTQTIWH